MDLKLPNNEQVCLLEVKPGRFSMGVGTLKPTPDIWGWPLVMPSLLFVIGLFFFYKQKKKFKGRIKFGLRGMILIILWLSAGLFFLVNIFNIREKAAAIERFNRRVYLASENEKPSHEVTISSAFYVSECEITESQFFVIMGYPISASHNMPMVDVSWYEAKEFCDKLSTVVKAKCRLPTEAEWEYLCLAGSETDYNTGDGISGWKLAGGLPGQKSKVPIRKGKPNQWGVYDCHSCVAEWVFDWYGTYDELEKLNPIGPNQGVFKVVRGGYGDFDTLQEIGSRSRSKARNFHPPADKYRTVGFRIVVESQTK